MKRGGTLEKSLGKLSFARPLRGAEPIESSSGPAPAPVPEARLKRWAILRCPSGAEIILGVPRVVLLGALALSCAALCGRAQTDSGPISSPPLTLGQTNQNPRAEELRQVFSTMDLAVQRKDWDKVAASLKEAEKLLPATTNTTTALNLIRFKMLLGKTDYPAAYALAEQLSAANPGDVPLNNDLAWQIVTVPGLKPPGLALAEKLALQAQAAAQNKDARTRCGVLDTLARVRFLQGKPADAAALEEQALQLADDSFKAPMRKTLESYHKAQAPSPAGPGAK